LSFHNSSFESWNPLLTTTKSKREYEILVFIGLRFWDVKFELGLCEEQVLFDGAGSEFRLWTGEGSTAGTCLELWNGPAHRTWERGYFCTVVGQAAILWDRNRLSRACSRVSPVSQPSIHISSTFSTVDPR
jgi:hypothetical protein